VLDGFTLVVSGIFSEITREKLEALISEYGGRVTGSISGKTDYLVVGYKLEDGREVTQGGKYRNASAKKKPILDEAGF
jgi:replication factor C subunit 1